MKIIIISPKNRTLYNFRGDLIRKIIDLGHEVIVTGPNNNDLEEVLKLGVRFVVIKMNKTGVNPISDYIYMRKLTKLLRRERPDITLGYTIKPVVYGSLASKKAKVKNICVMITGAGYLFTANTLKAKILRKFAVLLYKRGLKAANTVIFQNQDDLHEFASKKLVDNYKSKIVNGSGVNLKIFQKTEYPEQITFFMLSRIMYSKGVREYLEASKIIKERYPNVRFMLLGAIENIQDTVPHTILKPFIDNNIIEHFGETSDVKEFYKQCSIYVLPSYREGTPRTVLEAMSMGRAIITTDAPGCRETVIDGVNGFIVPIKNVEKLVEYMEFFINNPDKIISMGEASRLYCEEKFDVDKVNIQMLKHMSIL